jgi:hypothetical protein
VHGARSSRLVSRETLRRILHEGKVSWQTTTTWKSSNDPDFIAKMHRVLALYGTPRTDGWVVCVDEFGPLNVMPRKGKAWRPLRSPRRLRATYNRYDGVMYMLAALDLGTGKMSTASDRANAGASSRPCSNPCAPGEQNAAINAYMRWRNARAEPRTNFAPDSPIRTWTCNSAKAT